MMIFRKHFFELSAMGLVFMVLMIFSLPVIVVAAGASAAKPMVLEADLTKHIFIGPEVVYYIQIFLWAIGIMFSALSACMVVIGYFMKRTLDRLDSTDRVQE